MISQIKLRRAEAMRSQPPDKFCYYFLKNPFLRAGSPGKMLFAIHNLFHRIEYALLWRIHLGNATFFSNPYGFPNRRSQGHRSAR
jgi:hypothetical protein